ncbi:MAG: glycoside hydrolase family 2 protein [Prolixibacteraceae bacterium]|jgi:beta-galactosidase|nr:glycoside hydrolase family 2 protein [Prolixibacteraceae bacterium]MBT6005197.1 glycoside hydrolase family 2 protein [Prolixibacteraceae bacterium]MBT6766087.1 glycoside hydrolase family 2 protein [Prolixibacteraceae bacterium]MBT6996841.1 glycoside hydrolase family 2 protein [Prolixibacteraceae bacterium]MBT7395276.1 glycoside hydrolase family 2 protein [Prolixibacteraceae bacterium]
MKRIHKLLVSVLLVCLILPAAGQRQTISLIKDWNFKGSSIWEESINKKVNLPHTWNSHDAAQGYKYYQGKGIYTKNYFVDNSLFNKRLFLKFEGAQTVADVSINGKYIGQHRGGYSAFVFEITNAVNFDEENILEVKVDNSETEDVLPLGGDFNIYGGIYRPVELLITEKACITPLDFASPGMFLVQKNVSKESAEIEVISKISNGKSNNENFEIEATIKDASGNIVQSGVSSLLVNAFETKQTVIPINIQNPHLWNGIENPYLYSVVVQLKEDGKVLDEVTQPLGIRYYSTDAEKGFYLNGEHVKIKGVSRHNDFAGVASALKSKHHRIDMELIKEMGANGIRLAHYQHSDFFYSLADTSGMIVWAEIPFVGSDQQGFHDSEEFQKNAKQQLQELIRQNYNHPSILFWGLYNEIGMKYDSTLTSIITDLHQLAIEEDPSRPTVAATFVTRSADPLHKIPEMIAWNQYYGWYYSKPDKLGDFLDRIHKEEPAYKIGVSEYGAGGSTNQHEEKIRRPFPFFHEWHPEEFQATVHEGNWKAINDRPFVWGSFVWNMFDFGSHFRREGDAIGINDKGMVSYDRKRKKDVFYFYKANWSEEPVIRICNSRFAIREKDKIKVKIYSNLENVELFVNGKSAGTQTGENATLVWENISLLKGNNRVKAVGQKNEKTYSHSVVWMYEKSAAISFAITFLRWLIKPFIVLLLASTMWFIWLLFKKRVKNWRKISVIFLLVLMVLILVAIAVAQIFGARFGINLFEYSLI